MYHARFFVISLIAIFGGFLVDIVSSFLTSSPYIVFSGGSLTSTLTSLFGFSTSISSNSEGGSSSARDLLYQDQQDAMHRRAIHEQHLLTKGGVQTMKELLASKFVPSKPKSGTGFGGGSSSVNKDPAARMALEQADVIRREGVLRINNVISNETADNLRVYILEQQQLAKTETDKDASTSRTYYGVENRRKCRTDLQLSLLRGGFASYLTPAGDENFKEGISSSKTFPLGDALQEMLGHDGTLRSLFEALVTLDGELYELAAVVTDKGSDRQMVHPDLPYQENAPLYVIFLALQDVTEGMGPTSFLLRTNTGIENAIFSSGDMERKNEQLSQADCRISTLRKGEAVLFDARILHCGNSNNEQTRVLFNYSFRNPQVVGSLGYKGSIRPCYEEAMTLRDLADALDAYKLGDNDPFAKYN
jgi:hypothetical protein